MIRKRKVNILSSPHPQTRDLSSRVKVCSLLTIHQKCSTPGALTLLGLTRLTESSLHLLR